MQKCYECGKHFFGTGRHCPKCGADQLEGKYGDSSRFSLQNVLKEIDWNEDAEEGIFVGELIVKKMLDDNRYDEFGWKAVDALINIYTTNPDYFNFKRAIELCPIYGKCMHADFEDDAKITAEERMSEIYELPDCDVKPARAANIMDSLMTRLLKDIEEMPAASEYNFVGRTIPKKEFGRALYNLNKYLQGQLDLPSAPHFIYYIGKAYETGQPFPQNTKYARAWYKEAAKRGDPDARKII